MANRQPNVSAEEFKRYDREAALQWLLDQRLLDENEAPLIRDFEGIIDFLPVLGDGEPLSSLREIIQDMSGGKLNYTAINVARIKQRLREWAGIGQPAAPSVQMKKKLIGAGDLLRRVGNVDALARTVSEIMSFSSNSSDAEGPAFIKKLFKALDDDSKETEDNVKDARQLKLVGPSNNGKTELAQWMARMWVASAPDEGEDGRWMEEIIKRTTMDAHFWSARESTGSDPREVWGPLRYLFYKSWEFPRARFALVINEANRGNLLDVLNQVWWEKRRNYPSNEGVPDGERLPKNLALIFTENLPTEDEEHNVVKDTALYTRLTEDCTFALIREGMELEEYEELGISGDHRFSTKNVGLIYAAKRAAAKGKNDLKATLLRLASGGNEGADVTDFANRFGVSVSDFRGKAAGWQTTRVRNYPPLRPSPAPAPAPVALPQAPEAMDILDTRHAVVKKFLEANPHASLEFADETSNSQEAFSPYYTWLRNQLSAKQHRATMAEIITLTTGSDLEKSVYLYGAESTKHGIRMRIASWVAPCREKASGKIRQPGCIKIVNRVAFDAWQQQRAAQPAQQTRGRSPSPPATAKEQRSATKKRKVMLDDGTENSEDEEMKSSEDQELKERLEPLIAKGIVENRMWTLNDTFVGSYLQYSVTTIPDYVFDTPAEIVAYCSEASAYLLRYNVQGNTKAGIHIVMNLPAYRCEIMKDHWFTMEEDRIKKEETRDKIGEKKDIKAACGIGKPTLPLFE